MHLEVNANDVTPTEPIMEHIRSKVDAALRSFGERVTRVEVHLNDTNAGKGGVDKRCMMEARLAGQQPLVAEHHSDDLYNAISVTAEKLERSIRKRIDREQDARHHG